VINLIVAYDKNKIIGKDNKIPWSFSDDMLFFKEITTDKVCLMGRKTWESLPDKFRPLPNRKNLIVSKTYKNYPDSFIKTITNLDKFDDIWTTSNIKSSLKLAEMNWPNKEIFIIGGYQIYKYFLDNDLVDAMFITEINNHYEGDTYFPFFNENNWNIQMIRCFEKLNIYKYTKK
jgi:dihydrofolate reductase